MLWQYLHRYDIGADISNLLTMAKAAGAAGFSSVKYTGSSGYKSAAEETARETSSSVREEFSETIDFFERRITVLDASLDLLKSGLENVTGAFAKNSLIDGQLDINKEKVRNYSDALAMYTGEAKKLLSSIPSGLAELKNIIAQLEPGYNKISERTPFFTAPNHFYIEKAISI